MIVLAIITIIATASVPQVQMWTARNRGKAAISNIISDFAKARAIASYAMEHNSSAALDDDTQLVRKLTGVLFRKSSYVILQKDPTETSDWNENSSKYSTIKKRELPMNVSLEIVNAGATNDGTGTSPTLELTSSGRVKQSNGLLVPVGAGAGNLSCGSDSSPLNGRRIFVAIMRSEVKPGKSIWYQIEIDQTGEYFICTQPEDSSTMPDFQGSNANILEM